MRKPTSAASLARLVAALFAAPVIAHALPAAIAFHTMSGVATGSSTTSAGTTANNSTSQTVTAPAPASSSSSSTSPGTSSQVIAPTNTTSTDQRAAATTQAVQAERASGNTAASQFQAATASPGSATVSQTTGATSANSATATSAGSSGMTTTTTTAGGVTSVLGFPGSIGTIVNSGEPVVDTNGNIVSANAAYVAPQVTEIATYGAPQYVGADVVVADNTMNQVIGQAKRDRHRVGRNGQLLYSIAPRTNVDRSAEVPDDGPSPALKGPLAR